MWEGCDVCGEVAMCGEVEGCDVWGCGKAVVA